MPVKINSVVITPAPTPTFEKVFVRNSTGIIGAGYSITLEGNLLAYKGNPTSVNGAVSNSTSGVYSSYSPDDDPISSIDSSDLLITIMKKQEYLRNIVSSGQSLLLEIVGFNSNSGIRAYCEVDNIKFDDQSRWTNRCGYTISLSTNRFLDSANDIFDENSSEDAFTYYVSEAAENWSIQEMDGYTATTGNIEDQKRLYSISHRASANGKNTYASGAIDKTAIYNASGYVHSVIGLGYGNMPASIMLLSSGLQEVNRKFVETIDEFSGLYEISEEFTLCPSGQLATETTEVSIQNDLGSIVRVSINGTITGLNTSSVIDRSVNRYTHADSYWTSVSGLIYTRANTYLGNGCSLNTTPNSSSIGRNFQEGIITYNYEYNNRPANLITGALIEDIQIQDTYPGQNFNPVQVIGRSQPIIQYVNSRSEYKRSLQITANMPFSGCLAVKPPTSDLTTIFNLYKPTSSKTYYSAPVENWNPKTGEYSYSIEWTFEGQT